MTADSTSSPPPGSSFNPNQATISRTYADFRGGANDTFTADREATKELRAVIERVDEVAQENAAALVRAVRHLAKAGHDQYADLGCGRPMQGLDALKLPDLAILAKGIQPDCRWLALDSDELVVTACRALLRLPGIDVAQKDLRNVDAVLDAIAMHLDLTVKPIVVLLGAVVHFMTDEEASALMSGLRACLAPGSIVVLTHVTSEGVEPEVVAAGKATYKKRHGVDIYVRTREEIASFADGFVIRAPGIGRTIDFMPEEDSRAPVREAPHFLMWMAERPHESA
ncbi:SAM-dependent methyltransferase [Nonomuraea turcica]|uniref:SAM-dependent methyltransferase n=1 Tax=Nonomuraea sp. G32 TaxID=3067274 RepID=UPI00273B6882|nr:SAM-dependent methyltransferase [Nonomuraea sp. G32]MDP4511748.1 SAM-dependent methyltransferase [Nonomuraea sp. G32]